MPRSGGRFSFVNHNPFIRRPFIAVVRTSAVVVTSAKSRLRLHRQQHGEPAYGQLPAYDSSLAARPSSDAPAAAPHATASQGKSDERYCFVVDWFDPTASLVRKYQLIFYTADGTVEMVRATRRHAVGRPTCASELAQASGSRCLLSLSLRSTT